VLRITRRAWLSLVLSVGPLAALLRGAHTPAQAQIPMVADLAFPLHFPAHFRAERQPFRQYLPIASKEATA
jgi:hypothetical protein